MERPKKNQDTLETCVFYLSVIGADLAVLLATHTADEVGADMKFLAQIACHIVFGGRVPQTKRDRVEDICRKYSRGDREEVNTRRDTGYHRLFDAVTGVLHGADNHGGQIDDVSREMLIAALPTGTRW